MKRKDVGSPSATAGAYLRFQYTKSDGNSGFLYSPYVTGTNEDWERMELTFTLPSDAASSTVYIGAGIRNTTGTIWVDNVQLEEGNLANRYNLIENGDFTYKGLGWTSWYDASTGAAVIPTTDPAHPTSLSTNVYPIKGDSTLNKAISQNVKVSGGKGDALSLVAGAVQIHFQLRTIVIFRFPLALIILIIRRHGRQFILMKKLQTGSMWLRKLLLKKIMHQLIYSYCIIRILIQPISMASNFIKKNLAEDILIIM